MEAQTSRAPGGSWAAGVLRATCYPRLEGEARGACPRGDPSLHHKQRTQEWMTKEPGVRCHAASDASGSHADPDVPPRREAESARRLTGRSWAKPRVSRLQGKAEKSRRRFLQGHLHVRLPPATFALEASPTCPSTSFCIQHSFFINDKVCHDLLLMLYVGRFVRAS